MTINTNNVETPQIDWDYMEKFGKIFDEEFRNLDRDQNGNRRLKINFNENIDIPEHLRKMPSEVKGYFQTIVALTMIKVIDRGYTLAPICMERRRLENEEGGKSHRPQVIRS